MLYTEARTSLTFGVFAWFDWFAFELNFKLVLFSVVGLCLRVCVCVGGGGGGGGSLKGIGKNYKRGWEGLGKA